MTTAQANPEGVFGDLLSHCNSGRTSTELTLRSIFKQRHPDHHVAHYHPIGCDLHGYAKAGFATSELVDADNTYATTLNYLAPAYRLERKHDPGSLKDMVHFAQYKYIWTTTEFIVYNISLAGNRSCPEVFCFVLAPLSEGAVTEGRSKATEQLLLAVGQWTSDTHEEIWVFDSGNWMKNKELYNSIKDASWNDVILDSSMKDGLIEDVEGFFDSQELYREFQVPWKRGVIFHGLPGNGKTISLKALMSVLSHRTDPIPSLYVKSFDGNAGQQHSIRNIFLHARRMAPCLLIFEDLDALITEHTRSYFLNEVDGLEVNDGILMIGSTNHLEKLDPAIRDRPSRFDRKYFFKLPGEVERAAYVAFWKAKLTGNKRVEWPEGAAGAIAKMTEGFSFAYLKELFVASLLVIARGGKGDAHIPGPVNDTATSALETEAAPVSADETSVEAAAESTDKAEAARLRRQAFANVAIPPELRDSVLVRVVHQQISTLLEEMDNNEAPLRDRVPKPPPRAGHGGPIRTRPGGVGGRMALMEMRREALNSA